MEQEQVVAELARLAEENRRLRADVTRLSTERIPHVDRSSRRRDRRLTLAYLFVAIFSVGLAGLATATALPGTDTVDGGDIVNGTVSTSDVKDGTLGAADVKQSAWVNLAANPTSGGEPCGNGVTATFCGVSDRKWANYGDGFQGARFSKDLTNRVHLEGLVREVFSPEYQGGIAPTPIFVLPAGHRPAATLIFSADCATAEGPSHARIDIFPNGRVVSNTDVGCSTSGYVSLTGISFRAGR
ncbi:hypothetical protein [Nocardioides stalactiti]|uniref:hypothetical protein n=1 Tax=Nocardioides stalactiti TaxID=2755356 RepID=UPI001600F0D4|nr:hypothetical protein [Nocardioides stalactiti]